MKLVSRITLCLLAFAVGAANAQQYKWSDDKGRVHYTDTPPPASAKSSEKRNLRGNAVGAQPDFQLATAMKNAPVKLYSHPDCKSPCQMARDVLNRRGVPFDEISAADPGKLEELQAVSGGQSVPVLVVGSYVEKNPTAKAYDEALDWAGYPPVGRLKPGSRTAPPAPPSVAASPADPSADAERPASPAE
jgi:glutaredoxin